MDKIKSPLYIILMLMAMSLTCARSSAGNVQDAFFAKPPKYEVRAVWLTTLGGLDWPRFKSNGTTSIERQKKELTDILDKLKDANINTVLFQARIRGTVIYPSKIEPWDECLTGFPGRDPGYDPLAFAIDECHKRGMEIQAWVVAVPVGKWSSPGCTALRKKHPGLVVRRGNEGFIDPANPAAATYISEICKEITSQYDIDGIHLDYIRYPETWFVRTVDRKRRNKDMGNISTLQERQQNITRIVRAVHDGIKGIKPWVKLSCSPIGKYSDLVRYSSKGWNALAKGCQDAQSWISQGLMDQLYPMMYFKGNNFYPFLLDWAENRHGRTVVAGLGIYFLSRTEGNWPIDEVKRQMNISRHYGMGYAMFREKFFRDDIKGLYGFTKDIFSPFPALVPPMVADSANKPGAPINLEITCDGEYKHATWSDTPTKMNEEITYNIYASRTYPVDTDDARNLIAIRKKDRQISIKDGSGLFLAITAVNRYGQESSALQERMAETQAVKTPLIPNDGIRMQIPEAIGLTDSDYIMLKNISGTIKAVFKRSDAYIDIRGVEQGFYSVYSLNSKGVTHRLGFVKIMR